MQHDADVIVVGAGLAGAAAALTLSPTLDVHVLEKAEAPATGASGAAAGLVNPFMGRRARPVWRLREALNAVSTILERAAAAELFPPQGVLRPVVEDDQEPAFREAAREHPDLATWLSPAAVHDRFPDVRTSTGGFYVPEGGAIDVPAMVEALLAAAQKNGATVETVTEFGEPARVIGEYAGDHDVDLIVMGCHGRSTVSRILLGDVAGTVVRRAPVPVTVVR